MPLNLPPTYMYNLDQVQCRANRGQGRYRSNRQLTVCLYLITLVLRGGFMGGCIIHRFDIINLQL